MALEEFDSSQDKLRKEAEEKCEIISPEGVDWTACSCDVSDIFRFEEPVNELDLIGHLREEHGYQFEDAKQRVRKYKEINEALE